MLTKKELKDVNNNFNSLGECIKSARVKSGFSQEQLAETLDITPTHVKHIESGHRKPSIEILFKIALILNMSVDNVIFKKTENDKDRKIINDINNMLTKCNTKELNVVKDLVESLIRNI